MLDRGASYILCKRGALHEAMRSVGRVGVRAARPQRLLLASVLQALAQLSSARPKRPLAKNLARG